MLLRVLRIFFIFALALMTNITMAQNSGSEASDQDEPKTKPPLFPILFPNPTHNNGFEELIQATDLIQNNRDADDALASNATLAFKRRMLNEKDVSQALALLHEALSKPFLPPHDRTDENTLYLEMAACRKLARLLNTAEYVEFAEGRVDAAIDSLRTGLAFGYYIQTDTILSGLIGMGIQGLVLKQFAGHLDQLSVYHCDKVLHIVQDFLQADSSAGRLFADEKSRSLNSLEARRSDAGGLRKLLDSLGIQDENPHFADLQSLQNYLTHHADELDTVLDDASTRISDAYDRLLLNLHLPVAQQKPYADDRSGSPGATLARLLVIDLQYKSESYTRNQVFLHLLGVHALIHHYHWDHNKLPSSLAELHADEMVKDPFTGDSILYKLDPDGEHYTLVSAGPRELDETGNLTNLRTPVKLGR